MRDDDRDFYEGLARHAGDESAKGAGALWNAITHALPRWRSKRRSNLVDQFLHYDGLEAGHAVTYEHLLQRCHDAQKAAAADIPLSVDLAMLPPRLYSGRLVSITLLSCANSC